MALTDGIIEGLENLGLDLFEHEKVQINSYEDKVNPEIVQTLVDYIDNTLPKTGVGVLFASTLKGLINSEQGAGVALLKNEETLLFMDVENFIKRAATAQGIVNEAGTTVTEVPNNVETPLASPENSKQPNQPGSTVRPTDRILPAASGTVTASTALGVDAGTGASADTQAKLKAQESATVTDGAGTHVVQKDDSFLDKFDPANQGKDEAHKS